LVEVAADACAVESVVLAVADPGVRECAAEHHRHNKPVPGCVSVVGVTDGEKLRGVAVIGRPIARLLDDGQRCDLDGCSRAKEQP
jgi:hypothetical protein